MGFLIYFLSFKGPVSPNNSNKTAQFPLFMIKKLDNKNTYTGLEFKEQ